MTRTMKFWSLARFLPEEIDIGTALHYEMFTYSIV